MHITSLATMRWAAAKTNPQMVLSKYTKYKITILLCVNFTSILYDIIYLKRNKSEKTVYNIYQS